ncbi:MAG: ABC transporter, permease protein 2 (cluster 5, nickel/peptides/opines) [uncultured Thermomicrobiales bacterium]|uniref:ABC transporter, permease protein 2 (Cluster 5, nickel/peptides/opines) n=1 Tax=uncultured Thermomicrobiales bacterium TaxID=1645740 RepID=A0A6J4UD07_9BACT|nr:MAG: ABC transporter, permease protein 2 (cluster 5, nickel/peptides/opines) [uncultured Thermomicrobiales bacterium]
MEADAGVQVAGRSGPLHVPVAAASPARQFVRRLARKPRAVIGGAVIAAMVVAAVFAPVVAPYDPTKQDFTNLLQGPSPAHLLGTDELGRDTLSRVIYGARVSLQVGIIAVGLSLIVGGGLGLISGYSGGVVDTVIMRIMDGLLAFPALVLALAITAMLGPNLRNAMIAIGVTGIPSFARLIRGQVLVVRDLEYVQAAHSVGARHGRIMVRHVLPNTIAPIIVETSVAIPAAILAEAGLSFLGLGIQPPMPSWGAMINTAQGYMQREPWIAIAPGAAILVAVLAFNFLGDALRDALDPRLK